MNFAISHGHAIRSVFGRSRVTHFMSVEVNVDEERREPAERGTERHASPTLASERTEPEHERGEGGREDARAGVLEADGEDGARGVDEEVAAGMAQDEVPEQRRQAGGERTRHEHAAPPLAE